MKAMDCVYNIDNGEERLTVRVNDYEFEQIDETYQATMIEDFFVYNVQCSIIDQNGRDISEICLLRSGELEVAGMVIQDILDDEVY